uniref:Uncharacterized protein n=1 Tax=Pseudo-nitzschia australis TaxID=44445 RepID=A0A7S4ALI3_9STRA
MSAAIVDVVGAHDDHGSTLSVIPEEESSFISSASTFPSQKETLKGGSSRATTMVMYKPPATDNNKEEGSSNNKNTNKNTIQNKDGLDVPMAIDDAKRTAAKLFGYKKKLAIVWKKLEKAERTLDCERERERTRGDDNNATATKANGIGEGSGIPVKITVETIDAYGPKPDAGHPFAEPLVQKKPGKINLVENDDNDGGLGVVASDIAVRDPISREAEPEDRKAERMDVFDYLLNSLGVDKICGLDDAAVLEAAAVVAAKQQQTRAHPPKLSIPVSSLSSPLLNGSCDHDRDDYLSEGRPNKPVLVTPTSRTIECGFPKVDAHGTDDALANKAVFWNDKLVRHRQRERKRLILRNGFSSSAIDPFRNEFIDDDDDALDVFGRLASLCDPAEFDVDD